jgi:asparagine synthase (glutamine-hydrolysing)
MFAKYPFISRSDCEVLLPLYSAYKEKMAGMLDAEFAFVLYDKFSNEVMAARDPIGIRPLFYGKLKETGKMAFASEAKALHMLCAEVAPFPPGHVYYQGKFTDYAKITQVTSVMDDLQVIDSKIRSGLTAAVTKRLMSDVPIGYLLSGGLDSSLVCALAQRMTPVPIDTFAIGMVKDAIDLKYARQVADFIGSNHHEVTMTMEDVLQALKHVVYHLESYDITTIRASMGMYLLCRYIKENTDIKVLMTGEISDELFGYKYTDFAPSGDEFQKESEKRIKELYMYDVLRADRCIAAWSLEARVPFGDLGFVRDVMAIRPELKMNTNGQGKYLLRKAFESEGLLPSEILWREKAAFSDAVGHSMVEELKKYAQSIYTDEDVKEAQKRFPHCPPHTREALLYRETFEKMYPERAEMIPGFWMPNASWLGCQVDDPSARVLSNYGGSGK